MNQKLLEKAVCTVDDGIKETGTVGGTVSF